MSDTVALALIALIGAVNLTVAGMTHKKISKCGDAQCQAQIKLAGKCPDKIETSNSHAEASIPFSR